LGKVGEEKIRGWREIRRTIESCPPRFVLY